MSTEPAERLRELEEDVAPLAPALSRPSAGLSGAAVAELAERLEGRLFTPSLPNLHASYAHAEAHAGIAWHQPSKRSLMRPASAAAGAAGRGVCTAIPPRSRASAVDAPVLGASSNGRRALAHAQGMTACTTLAGIIERRSELPSEDFPAWLLIADLSQRTHCRPRWRQVDRTGRVYGAVHTRATDGEMNTAWCTRCAWILLREDSSIGRCSA